MWHLMVFRDEGKTNCVKVMEFDTIRDVAKVVGLAPQVVSNFYHHLIHPRAALKYVALFKS
eukprot:COSAG01_NODE_2882_length_6914_cov_40.714894_7_plen_61_part_00